MAQQEIARKGILRTSGTEHHATSVAQRLVVEKEAGYRADDADNGAGEDVNTSVVEVGITGAADEQRGTHRYRKNEDLP
jgi:hypothetical protein